MGGVILSDRFVHADAVVEEDVVIGFGTVIEAGARIGAGCKIGHHVVIHAGSEIGSSVRIDDHAVVGKQPMRAANSAVTKDNTQPPAKIGDHSIIGTGAVVYAGAVLANGVLAADYATIREQVQIGLRTIIGRGASVENQCVIGDYCKIETNVYITAYSRIGDRVFVAPCVATSNDNFVGRTKERFKHFKGVTIETGGRVGTNATILPGKTIEADALVAAGSLVTRDAPTQQISMGQPAQPIRPVPEEQLLENQDWQK
jgi:UDP-2-acetamido-3-amino-2,3-dideoxy-glucuronate N-acetyltransferase